METIINREILVELKKLVMQRGGATQIQREYARFAERGLEEIYPITKPSEEKRSSHLRTLERYIGEHSAKIFREKKISMISLNQRTAFFN